jgi:teichuronic acid biosynthesis glycosyltransferase TuaG
MNAAKLYHNHMDISIVMPAFNAEKTIRESIESVLSQTYSDYELIIVDDGSTDGTCSICAEYAACTAASEESENIKDRAVVCSNAAKQADTAAATEPEKLEGEADVRASTAKQANTVTIGRIRLLRNGINRGVAYSRNRGVGEARGQWVAFLDSDDLWQCDKLEKQLAFIRETGAEISYTSSAFIDVDGHDYGYIMHAEHKLTYRGLMRRNLMSCSSVIVRKDLILKVKFPEEKDLHEDYAAWLRIVRSAGAAYGLDEPLLIYRLQKSSKSAARLRSAKMNFNAYRHAGYAAPLAALLSLRYAVHSITKRIGIWLS